MVKPDLRQGASNLCRACGRILTGDEKALTRKLINRGAERFFCISCLAGHFDVSEEVLREKVREYREMGCTLFETGEKP